MAPGKRKVRAALLKRSVQALCFGLFVWLLATATSGPDALIPPSVLQQCDPLSALGALITGRTFLVGVLPGLLVILATVFLGRIFCGYVCPLGTTVDAAGKLFTPRKRRPYLGRFRRVKELMLVAVVTAALGGFALFSMFAPLPLLGRALAYVVTPALLGLADLGLDAVRPLAEDWGAVELARTTVDVPPVATGAVTLLILLVVLALVRVAPRLWCRALCPAGGLLGLCGARAAFRRVVDESCDGCGACARLCPMGAIPHHAPDTTDRKECTLCRTCAAVCPRGSIRFRFSSTGSRARPGEDARSSRVEPAAALSRRQFVRFTGEGAALGAAAAAWAWPRFPGEVVRPPGALPEPLFSSTCVRCGLCIRSCPTHTLRPSSGLDEGLAAFWTPRLDTRAAPCDPTCNDCGSVCPSGAIRKLPIEEKTYAKLGTAAVNRRRCLAWAKDHHCLVCDEVCPLNSIEFRPLKGRKSRVPHVVDARCNGCGACDAACPVKGISAIPVTALGEVRLAHGSYLEAGKRRGLVFKARKTEDVYDLPEEPAGGPPPGLEGGGEAKDGEKLPPGFGADPAEAKDGEKLPPGFGP